MTRTNFILAGFLAGALAGWGYNQLAPAAPPAQKSCCPAPEAEAPVDAGAATTARTLPAPKTAQAHYAAGKVQVSQRDWIAAAPAFERATLAAPTNKRYAAYARRARLEMQRAEGGRAKATIGPVVIDVKKLVAPE